jgi:hypothetical protein
MADVSKRVPSWWLDLLGAWHARDVNDLCDACNQAGVSYNDKINVTRLWHEMVGTKPPKEDTWIR